MKNKLLLMVVICLVVVFCCDIKKIEKTKEDKVDNDIVVNLKNESTKSIESKKLEDYVIGVVAAEMPASFNLEALKAQAVASRTYAMYKINHSGNREYDLTSTIDDQAFITEDEMKEKWGTFFDTYYDKIKIAVNSTKDEVLTYNGEVIEAFYYAMSNGYTTDSLSVFSADLPYIKSTESKWDNDSVNNFVYTVTFTKDVFCEKLNISCNSLLIENVDRDSTGRVSSIKINDKKFTGVEVRKLLGLRSTDFTINISDEVNITTKGYGHGVGMSQYGANGMAKEGKSYKEILEYYYNNVNLEKIVV